MEGIWIGVCNRGIAAGWLILAIAVFRLIFQNGSKRVRLYLWALVALRLVLPDLPESGFSLVPSADVIPQRIAVMEVPEIESGMELVDAAVNPLLGEYMPAVDFGPDGNPMQRALAWAALIWLTGMALLAVYSLIADIRLRLRLRDAVLIDRKELYSVKGDAYGSVFLYASEKISLPFTAGIGTPRIYLPFSLEEGTREHVIAHEMAHISHRDPWIKMAGWLLMIVFWFCPLMWLAWFLFERDMELACDERVIKGMSGEGRCSYSEALLSCSTGGKREPVGPLAFGAGDVKARVKSVLRYRRPTFWAVLAGIAACAAAVLCFATNPVGGSIELPQKEHILSVQLEIMQENASMRTPAIQDVSRAGELLKAMEGAKKTMKSGNSGAPELKKLDGRSYSAISWVRDDYIEEKWYIYSINGTCYLQQPYGELYTTNPACLEAFGELAADIDEWVSFTYSLLCFHKDGEAGHSGVLGGMNAGPLQDVIDAYSRKLVSSGASEQRAVQEKIKRAEELSGNAWQEGMGPQLAGVLYDRESVDLKELDWYYRISWQNDRGGQEHMLYVYETEGEPYMHMEQDTEGAFYLERELYEGMKALIRE